MNLTTRMLEELTEQDVFDIAAWHMLEQGERALNMDMCTYRAMDGKRCPVGWLIPDAEYRTMFEGRRVSGLIAFAASYGCSAPFVSFLRRFERLLGNLQKVHDNHAPFMWWCLLREVASMHGLNAGVIDHMKTKRAEREARDQAEALRSMRMKLPITFKLVPGSLRVEHFAAPVDYFTVTHADALALITQGITDAIGHTLGIPGKLLTTGSARHVIEKPQETREVEPA
jgi:hypothetical protein